MNHSSASRKKQQFREKIRQRQLLQHLKAKRNEYAHYLMQEEDKQIKYSMQNQFTKLKWLEHKAKQLKESPFSKWNPLLRQLLLVCDCVDEDCWEEWINVGIFDQVALMLSRKYEEFKLSSISAFILEQIVLGLPANYPLYEKIVKSNLVLDIISQCEAEHEGKQYYLELINALLSKDKLIAFRFIQCGIIKILVSTLDTDFSIITLKIVQKILRAILKTNKNRQYLNLFLIFLPILVKLICNEAKGQFLRVLLKCLLVLAISQNQIVLNELYNAQGFMEFLISIFSIEDQPYVHSITLTILASMLTSQNPAFALSIVKKGIINSLSKCWDFPRSQQCHQSILKLLSNIVSTSLDLAKCVLDHQIFTKVVASAQNYKQRDNNSETIFILATLIQYGNFDIIQQLLRRFYVLQVIFSGLRSSFLELENCLEILTCLIGIVKVYGSIGEPSKKKIVCELESLYNIEIILEYVEQKMSSSSVQAHISALLAEMYGKS